LQQQVALHFTDKSSHCNIKLLYFGIACSLLGMAKLIPPETPISQPRGEKFVRLVLETTLKRLANVGYERLSVPDIAELAAVNKTSIYRRWPSKAELVRDALSEAMAHANEPPNTGTLRGDLIELGKIVVTFMQSPVGKSIIQIMLSDGADPDLRAMARSAYGQSSSSGPWIVIKRAIERGELKTDIDPSRALFTLAGAIMHRVLVERDEVTDTVLGQMVDVVLCGVQNKELPCPNIQHSA
jgi:AcrR family transcriptional regulator